MNMHSSRTHGTEFHLVEEFARPKAEGLATSSWSPGLRHLAFLLVAVAVAYAIGTWGATALWILGGVCVAFLGLATAIGIYVMNNTMDMF